jgi:hypothetical protein
LFVTVGHAQKLGPIEDRVSGMRKIPGFMDLYWDEVNGRIYMEVNRWDTEVLYSVSLPAGLGSNDIGLDRAKSMGGIVVKFNRVGKKVFLVQPNYEFRALTNNASEKRAVEQSFASSTIWGFNALAETGTRVLVDATAFFLRDAVQATTDLRRMQQGNFAADSSRSAIYLPSTKNFPLNTEVEATITLVNSDGNVGNFVRSVTPTPNAVTLRMHHSFVQLPDDKYKPRSFDPRSSYMPVSYYDYSTPVAEPIEKFVIRRHRLEKKDPSAAKSEAVKPIVYYLDNGTPEPIRSALLEGASWWNQAFEDAGFINAFQVKVLPDSADPMDIRYNMINWVHRSTRGWSYGGGVTDPRTGEIIKGQVTLGSLRVRQDYLIAQGLLAPFEKGIPADDKMLKMALERLKQLSAHEVGHTLGLMHNYASSVNDRASVMDYPHPLVRVNAEGDIDLSKAYDNKIGVWDKVAINYGYREFSPGTDEKKALEKILDNADELGLKFISDQDARAPGGLHPTAHLWDNGKEPVSELNEVIRVREKALARFGTNNLREGMPMALLEDVLVPVYFYHRYQVEAACKLLGGMDYTYAVNGKAFRELEPLPKDVQLKALTAVLQTLQPEFLQVPEHVVKLIPPRPAGYSFSNELFRKHTGLAFDPLAPAETAADLPLSFIYHPERLSRMAMDTGKGLSLAEMNKRIIQATWKAPRRKGFNGLIQQQTEQVLLTYLLAAYQDEKASFAARASIRKTLDDLKVYIEAQKKTVINEQLAGHYSLALERMKAPEKAKPTQHAAIPPGAPIGCMD